MAHSSLLRQALTEFADRPLLILPDESNIDAGGRWEATPDTVHACTVLHAPYSIHGTACTMVQPQPQLSTATVSTATLSIGTRTRACHVCVTTLPFLQVATGRQLLEEGDALLHGLRRHGVLTRTSRAGTYVPGPPYCTSQRRRAAWPGECTTVRPRGVGPPYVGPPYVGPPYGLRVRTGYAYQPPAYCTYQRRRAAWPMAPRTVRTPYGSRPRACRT